MTRTYVCKGCQNDSVFIHTGISLICTVCKQPAVLVEEEAGVVQIVPFGVTRQIEELDRMWAL